MPSRRRRPPRPGALTELPPLRILGQIAALQAVYYLVAFVLVAFATLAAGLPFGLDLVLGWDAVRADTTQGFLMAFLWVLDGALAGSLAIIILVTRSRLVPDFALTLHLLHLLVTTVYTGMVPRNLLWWLAMTASAGACVSLATWGCRYRELRPISFGSLLGGDSSAASGSSGPSGQHDNHHHHYAPGSPLPEDAIDEESAAGLARGGGGGRGRGRGRDGAGEYELVEGPGRTRRQ